MSLKFKVLRTLCLFTMKRNSILLFFVSLVVSILATSLNAQEDISGSYHVRGNSPEGGANYVLFPDNTFVVGYFGGMITGTWQKDGAHVFFKNRAEPKFVLYGRMVPMLKDTVQIRFNVRENQGVAVGLNKTEPVLVKSVFNENANCFSYPYMYKQTAVIQDIYAITIPYKSADKFLITEGFHFKNNEKQNDFIVVNLPSEYTTASSFSAKIENGLLYFGSSSNGVKKRPLDSLSEEDALYLKNYTQNSLVPSTLNYGDEFFPYLEQPTEQDLTPFIRIEATFLNALNVELLEGSFFHTTCKD